MSASRRNRIGSRRWLLIVCVGAAVAAGGCTSSSPTDFVGPEPAIPLPKLTEPDSALYCIKVGIESKNLQLCTHALAESTVTSDVEFHAFFDPQDLADYGQTATPPTDWTSREERTFFMQFTTLIPVPSYTMALAPDANRADVLGPDETVYYRHYRVTYGPSQFLAVGLADLTFRRVGAKQEWRMVRWVDRRDTSATAVQSYGRRRLDSLIH